MGLFDMFKGNPNVDSLASKGDADGLMQIALTDPDLDRAGRASAALQKLVWNTLCLGQGWQGLYALLVVAGQKIVAAAPDDEHAKNLYFLFDQSIGRTEMPTESEIQGNLSLFQAVQQTLAALYQNGGNYFRKTLYENAMGIVTCNWINVRYLRELYKVLLNDEANVIPALENRIGTTLGGGLPSVNDEETCGMIIFDYLLAHRGQVPDQVLETIRQLQWRTLQLNRAFFADVYLPNNQLRDDGTLAAYVASLFP